MPTCYSTFLNEILQKQQKYYLDVGFSRQKIYTGKYWQKDFCELVQTYILWFKIKIFSIWCFDIWSFIDEGIGIHPILTKYIFFFAHPGWVSLNT